MKSLRLSDRLLLLAFLAWAAIGYAAIMMGITPEQVSGFGLPVPLESFARLCLHWGDFVFICLAFLNTYLAAGRRLGWLRTNNAAALILLVSGAVETVGTLTGYPFGAYHYTGNFGPRIADVLPVAIPLAWFIIITGTYLSLTLIWQPDLGNRKGIALAVALIATGIDFVMEPFAWHIREYWVWNADSIPVQNYASWLALSYLLARYSPLHVGASAHADHRPWIVLLVQVGLFVTARITYGL